MKIGLRAIPICLSTLLVIGSFPSIGLAQETDADTSEETSEQARPIEEISVVGQRSIPQLRALIFEKEQEIYEIFNRHNSSDKFDVICIRRRPTGSHIPQTECEPRFLINLRASKTRDLRSGIGPQFSRQALIALSAQDYATLQDEMRELMASNGEFGAALAEFEKLIEIHDSRLANAEANN